MKKLISTIISCAIAMSSVVSVFAADTFKDVNSNNWAYSYIEDMAKRGIISGYDDGTFRPEEPVTRAEFCTMAVLAAGISLNSNVNRNLLRGYIETDHWANSYMKSMFCNTHYYNEWYLTDNVQTEAYVSRAEAAMGIYELVDPVPRTISHMYDQVEYEMSQKYSDANEFGGHLAMIYFASKQGFISGYPDGTFKPANLVTRAQLCAMLHLAFDTNKSNTISLYDQVYTKLYNYIRDNADKRNNHHGSEKCIKFSVGDETYTLATSDNEQELIYVHIDLNESGMDYYSEFILKRWDENTSDIFVCIYKDRWDEPEFIINQMSSVINKTDIDNSYNWATYDKLPGIYEQYTYNNSRNLEQELSTTKIFTELSILGIGYFCKSNDLNIDLADLGFVNFDLTAENDYSLSDNYNNAISEEDYNLTMCNKLKQALGSDSILLDCEYNTKLSIDGEYITISFSDDRLKASMKFTPSSDTFKFRFSYDTIIDGDMLINKDCSKKVNMRSEYDIFDDSDVECSGGEDKYSEQLKTMVASLANPVVRNMCAEMGICIIDCSMSMDDFGFNLIR